LPRLLRRSRLTETIILGIGLAVVANTRPFEGLLLAVPVSIALAFWMFGRKRPAWRISVFRVALPLTGCVVVLGIAMGYFNWRVFGSPLTPPYQINRAMYAVAPYFIWQRPSPEPVYRHDKIRAYFTEHDIVDYQAARSIRGFVAATAKKVLTVSRFFRSALL